MGLSEGHHRAEICRGARLKQLGLMTAPTTASQEDVPIR